jgi:hypothetical protein
MEQPTEEQLKEWQEQQDAIKEQLKAQIDRSLVTDIIYHFEEEEISHGVKRVLKTDEWEITVKGVWQDRPK